MYRQFCNLCAAGGEADGADTEPEVKGGVINPIDINLSEEDLHRKGDTPLDHTPHKVSLLYVLR